MSARRTKGALLSALAVLILGVAGLFTPGSAPAGAIDGDGPRGVSIREIDSTDPSAVEVTFVYTGSRDNLDQVVARTDGEEVESSSVEPIAATDRDRATVFAIDTSRSMDTSGRQRDVQSMIENAIDAKGETDAIGIVSFDNQVREIADLTSDKATLVEGLADLGASGGDETRLWDGVDRSAALLADADGLQPNLVLVTDGSDTGSDSSVDDAVAEVTASGAVTQAVVASDEGDLAAVTDLVDSSGGFLYDVDGDASLGATFGKVADTIERQYVLSFDGGGNPGSEPVDLTLSVGDLEDSATYVPGSEASGQSIATPDDAGGSWMPDIFSTWMGRLVAISAVFVSAVLAIFAVVSIVMGDERSLDRVLSPYSEGVGGDGDDDDDALAQTAFLSRAVDFTEDFAERQGLLSQIEQKLEQADLPLRAAEALFFYAVGVVLIGAATLLALGPVMGLIAVVVSGLIPLALLNFLASRRQKEFNTQLPDMLQLLSGSLRAGYSFVQGVEAVSEEVAEPMGKELRRVCTEARLGRELEEALDDVAERMDSADFAWAVMAVRIQREVGGNLSELLLTVGETMIARERMRREVAALTAEGKISAIVLGIMPPALGVVMYVVNPEYAATLFTEPMGQGMLAVAVVAALVGFVWMKKTITIEI